MKPLFKWPLFWTLLALGMTSCRMKSTESEEFAASSSADDGFVTDLGPTYTMGNRNGSQLEVTLTVQETMVDYGNGVKVKGLTFNGVVPGPTIVANLGDELVLRVKNSSSTETILHPHGFVLEHKYDGTHLSQDPIPPGGEFVHRIKLIHAGTYWYHSHHDAREQMGRGLFGAVVVKDPNDPIRLKQKTLVFSNVAKTGQPVDAHNLLEPHMYLLNGKVSQVTSMRPGESQRYRIVNATAQHIVDLRLSNGQEMTLVGADSGLTERPYPVKRVRLVAGERADVVITAPSDGQGSVELIADPINMFERERAPNATFDPLATLFNAVPSFTDPDGPKSMLKINIAGSPAEPVRLPQTLASFPSPGPFVATRDFSVGMQVTPTPGASFPVLVKFPVNGKLYPDTPRPEEKLGTWVLHRWTNASASPHPIHLHGFRFMVLKKNGIPEPVKGWKDTVELTAFGSIEYAVDLREGYPGDWLYHCHFENHMQDGFMGSFIVRDPKNPANFPVIKPHSSHGHH